MKGASCMKTRILACTTLLALLLSGCTGTEPESIPTTAETTAQATAPILVQYSQEQAMIEGFVVIQDGDVRHNAGRWQAYMDAAESKTPASVTVMHFSHTEAGTTQMRMDLTFDGERHHLVRRENGVQTEGDYTTLLKRQLPLDDSREPYDSTIQYLLAQGDIQEMIFEDPIAETDLEGVTQIDFHLKEGEPALLRITDGAQVEGVLSLLNQAEYLSGDPETFYYGAKLLMTNGAGQPLVLELDLNQGNYRYGMQTYRYGAVSDLLNCLGLEDWPQAVYAEHGDDMQ